MRSRLMATNMAPLAAQRNNLSGCARADGLSLDCGGMLHVRQHEELWAVLPVAGQIELREAPRHTLPKPQDATERLMFIYFSMICSRLTRSQ
jgi:hypothetical protein